MGPGSVMCGMHALSIHNYLLERFPPLALAGGHELCLFRTHLKAKHVIQSHIYNSNV